MVLRAGVLFYLTHYILFYIEEHLSLYPPYEQRQTLEEGFREALGFPFLEVFQTQQDDALSNQI